MAVHFANCCLGLIPTTSPPNQPSVFNQLSAQTFEKPKSRRKRKTKVTHLVTSSVNMTGKERNSMRFRKGRHGVHTPSFCSPDSDYSLGLSQILVESEGTFRGTRSRVQDLMIMDSLSPPQGQYRRNY